MTQERVLHVVGAMNRGGAETMLLTLYRALDRSRMQFDFLEFASAVSDYTAEIEALGGRVLKFEWSQSPSQLPQTVGRLAQLMAEQGPFTAVHSHVLFASGTVLLAAKKAGVSVRIAHSHNTSDIGGGLQAHSYRMSARTLIRRSTTGLAACSEDAGNYLFGSGRFSARGVVVPNAVDTHRFFPAPASDRARRRRALGLDPERLLLVSIARLETVKNHMFLLRLASTLEARGVDFEMLFVGEGSLRPQLESEIASRGLSHRVRLLGLREDVDEVLRCSDALLMPSLFEGLPVALVEAQATGVVCLVSDSVTRDADLGLELLRYLPINDESLWADSIESGLPDSPPPRALVDALEARGYGVSSALAQLLSLYPRGPLAVV